MKLKILFICETVSLAHLMRTATLIKGLDAEKYSIHLAAGSVPSFLKSTLEKYSVLSPLESSISASVFFDHLAKGSLPYTESVVESQVKEDLKLIADHNPDLVVGDFRLSLGISSKIKKIPYINISNITWHPRAVQDMQVPDLKIVRLLGEKISRKIFKYLQPIIFRQLATPFFRVAKKWGQLMPKDLNSLYVSGDYVFYSDTASLVHLPSLESCDSRPNSVLGKRQRFC